MNKLNKALFEQKVPQVLQIESPGKNSDKDDDKKTSESKEIRSLQEKLAAERYKCMLTIGSF
jgi:hypothetical protein